MNNITSAHDNFLRAILADKQIAVDYFKSSLPVFILAKLDLSTLKEEPGSYVSDDLKKSISDIVYSCQRNDGKKPVKVSLLIEHKSYVDKYTPIQIGGYIFSGLLRQINNKEELSLIIPVLLYHGRKRWEYRTLSGLFKDIEPDLATFLPDFEYVYHNLGEISDDQIKQINNKFLAASFLALKYSFLKSDLETLIPEILSITQDVRKNLQSNLIVYIFVTSGVSEERMVAIIETLPITVKDTAMNAIESVMERGRKIGIEEGRVEGQNENREKVVRNLIKVSILSDEQIAAVAEVAVEFVVQMRATIHNPE